jgi:predicted methyltransferase MtxX (methanogen marker protein 4)
METYAEAEWIVTQLASDGLAAKHWNIDLNPAVEQGYNIHLPVNGMVGNQIFRVILFCGGKILAAPMLGLSRPYENPSRTERDLAYYVKWLTARINNAKNATA